MLAGNHRPRPSRGRTLATAVSLGLALHAAAGCRAKRVAATTATVRVSYSGAGALRDSSVVTVRVAQRGRQVTLQGARFVSDGRWAIPHPDSLVLAAPDSAVRVRVTLGPAASPLADTAFPVAVLPGYVHDLQVWAGQQHSRESYESAMCKGELYAVPLRRPAGGAAADSVYVTWGGLPRGAVC